MLVQLFLEFCDLELADVDGCGCHGGCDNGNNKKVPRAFPSSHPRGGVGPSLVRAVISTGGGSSFTTISFSLCHRPVHSLAQWCPQHHRRASWPCRHSRFPPHHGAKTHSQLCQPSCRPRGSPRLLAKDHCPPRRPRAPARRRRATSLLPDLHCRSTCVIPVPARQRSACRPCRLQVARRASRAGRWVRTTTSSCPRRSRSCPRCPRFPQAV